MGNHNKPMMELVCVWFVGSSDQ